ncbi:hypothetical protein U0070_025244 [Myodes glareolus]|uniref:60S ribosomal protein L17 n=1 Tax=Myodes glareolus TaxID=447135 RepID=A0AAW0INA8_MYOGA
MSSPCHIEMITTENEQTVSRQKERVGQKKKTFQEKMEKQKLESERLGGSGEAGAVDGIWVLAVVPLSQERVLIDRHPGGVVYHHSALTGERMPSRPRSCCPSANLTQCTVGSA